MPGASGSWELPLKPEGLEETPSIPQLLDYLSPGLGRAIANYQARTTGAPFYAGQPTAAPNVPKPEEAAWMLQPSSAPLAAAITKEELKRLFSHPEVAPVIEDLVRYWPTQYLDPLKVTTPKLPALRAKAGSSSAAGVYYPHLREMEVSSVGREVMGLWKEGISPKRQIETFKHEGGHYAEDFIQNPAEMKQIVARMKDIGINVDDHIMDWWRSTGYATDWKVAAASEHFARKFEQLSPNEIEHVLDPIFTRLKQSVKKPSFAEWRATNPLSGAIKKKSEEELIPRIERQLAEAKTKGDKYYIKKFEDQLRRAKKGAETGQWESELGGFAPDVTGIMVP